LVEYNKGYLKAMFESEQTHLEFIKQLASDYPTYPFPFLALFNHYADPKVGDDKQALKNLKIALRNFFDYHLPFPFEFARAGIAASRAKSRKFDDPVREEYNHLAMLYNYVIGGMNQRIFEDLEFFDNRKDNLGLQLSFASLVESVVENSRLIYPGWIETRNSLWQRCVKLVLDGGMKIEPLGETQNEVYFAEDEFVFKVNSRREHLESEKGLALKIKEELIKNHRRFTSKLFFDVVEPRFLSDEPDDGKHVYAMRFDSGRTLMDLIEDGSDITTIFDAVVEYTALLHANMPRDGKRLDVKVKTEDRLAKLQDELPDRVRKLLGENFTPFYETIDGFEPVWNSDGHPEQWIINDNRITRLDTEDRGLVPFPMDLVNIGEYVRDENLRNLRGRMLTKYPKHFTKFAGRELDGDLELGYLSSVGPRLISMFSAWSSGNRPRMRERRGGLILNSIESIDTLREKYPEVYRKNQESYDRVKQGFSEMLIVV
jgi:hypothetical protein